MTSRFDYTLYLTRFYLKLNVILVNFRFLLNSLKKNLILSSYSEETTFEILNCS